MASMSAGVRWATWLWAFRSRTVIGGLLALSCVTPAGGAGSRRTAPRGTSTILPRPRLALFILASPQRFNPPLWVKFRCPCAPSGSRRVTMEGAHGDERSPPMTEDRYMQQLEIEIKAEDGRYVVIPRG